MSGFSIHIRRLATTSALLLSMLSIAHAQTPKPTATPGSDKLKIGEQTDVELAIDYLPKSKIQFPSIGDTLTSKVEVVKKTPVDTAFDQGPTGKLVQNVTVTSFDTGYHAVPPLHFLVDDDTVATKPFLLEIETVKIDTTRYIKDIEDVEAVDITWKDYLKAYWPWMAGGAGLIALAAVAVIFYRRWRKKQSEKEAGPAVPAAPQTPSDEWALQRLNEIEKQKLWQQGKVKQYYVEVTYVVREFIERRFMVQAQELTTNDIIKNLKLSSARPESTNSLRNMLQLADFVKFARFKPGETEHNRVLALARDFVTQNRPMAEDDGETDNSNNQKQDSRL